MKKNGCGSFQKMECLLLQAFWFLKCLENFYTLYNLTFKYTRIFYPMLFGHLVIHEMSLKSTKGLVFFLVKTIKGKMEEQTALCI